MDFTGVDSDHFELPNMPRLYPSIVASLNGVSYRVAEGRNTRILFENVNAGFRAGALSAIVGPSGSGKSSLLSILGGLIAPSAGSVVTNNVNLAALTEVSRCRFRREHVGFVFQDIRLLPHLNALDNVQLPAWFRYRDPTKAHAAAVDALHAVDMLARVASMPSTMSGGEKQRVALARVLACDPPLILADEPTAALDWASAEVFLNLLLDRAKGGKKGGKNDAENDTEKFTEKAAVLVTHDPRVLDWVEHIYHLENGRLRYESNAESYASRALKT